MSYTLNQNDESQQEDVEQTDETPTEPPIEEQLTYVKDQWLRSIAELDNLRKRAQKEKEEAFKYSTTNFAKTMLDVADNVARALLSAAACHQRIDNVPDPADKEFFASFISGVEMIGQAFTSALESQNITMISALHQPFDPNLHQALMEVETDEYKPGTVIQVIQEGYRAHERLLRPTLVAIAKAPTSKGGNTTPCHESPGATAEA